jgi:multidrug efflux system membrane fusion protein
VKRFLPTLVLLLITAAALAFIYKDQIFPRAPGERAEEGGPPGAGGGGGRRGGRRGGGDPNRPVPVLAEAATKQNVPVYLNGVGTMQAYNTATVRAQVSGRLIAVNYDEGQDVKRGDVLAQIDPVTYKAEYDQAVARKGITEALLANARRDLQRYESLVSSNAGSRQQADTQRALVQQYEAQIRQEQAVIDAAKANLDFTTIRAPIDGRTGIRQVDIGNLVTSGDSGGIVVITQLQPISVLFTLPETVLPELIAAKARGTVGLAASVGGETLAEGQLEVIDNRIEEATGTVRLKGTFSNTPLRLWPGQFVNIRLHLKTLQDATVVPAVAVQQGASGRFVYVATPENTAKLTPVTVTQEDERQAVIAAGLQPGDRVVTTGFANLQDGARISLDNADGRQPDAQPGAQSAPQADRAGPRGQGRERRGEGGESGGRRSEGGDRPAPVGGAAERLPTGGATAAGQAPQDRTGRTQ